MSNPKAISIDQITKTSSIQIFSPSGQLETTYTYANGIITLSERLNNITGTLQDLRNLVEDIKYWLDLIERLIGLEPETGYDYEHCSSRTGVVFGWRHFVNGVAISNAAYNKNTKKITFQPRAEVVLSRDGFNSWVSHLDMIIADISALR